MKIFYDTEFLDDGRVIDLISIGMITEDGREYYAVNADAQWGRIKHHDWLMKNVVPQLPSGDGSKPLPKRWLVDFYDPHVKAKPTIAAEVAEFIKHTPKPELWAYYAAYDHVALAQLFGPMANLPDGIPMWTNDFKQELVRLGNPRTPSQTKGGHHALADARHLKVMYERVHK
jgi:hypothetical protein